MIKWKKNLDRSKELSWVPGISSSQPLNPHPMPPRPHRGWPHPLNGSGTRQQPHGWIGPAHRTWHGAENPSSLNQLSEMGLFDSFEAWKLQGLKCNLVRFVAQSRTRKWCVMIRPNLQMCGADHFWGMQLLMSSLWHFSILTYQLLSHNWVSDLIL